MINIEKDFKFKQNDKIVIGCSNGPNSMALVDMLLKIRNKYNLSLIIAHVNHNVRKYDLSKKEFPITTLRPIGWKGAIKEMLWIFQKKSNDKHLYLH